MAMVNSRNMYECFSIQELVRFVAHDLGPIIIYVNTQAHWLRSWVTWLTSFVRHSVWRPVLGRFMNDELERMWKGTVVL